MNKSFRFTLACILILSLLLPHFPIAAVDTSTAEPSSDLDTITESSTALPLTSSCQILNYVDKEVFASGNHIARLPA